MASNTGVLYLIPSLLGDSEPLEVLPISIKKIIEVTDSFIVENEKSARAFIKRVLPSKNQPELNLFVLNKFTEKQEYKRFLEPCRLGQTVGIISEAGAPCIADPGSEIVALAHAEGIQVVPLVGPSSIFLALMASGFNGQRFAFNGYLPVDTQGRKKALRQLEAKAMKGETQIFMETPYRNMRMLEDAMAALDDRTMLCVAADITLPDELINTKPVHEWKKRLPELSKRPCIFILGR